MVTNSKKNEFYAKRIWDQFSDESVADLQNKDIADCRKFGVGLSGGVATGKSTISGLLRKRGYLVVDADDLARRAVELGSLGLDELVDLFGKKILLADGNLDRDKLRQIITEDNDARLAVNDVLHPHIEDLLLEELGNRNIMETQQLWFYEAALLVETGNYKKYRQLWVCACQRSTQIHRLMARDKVTHREARQLIDTQWDNEDKVEVADFVIDSEQPIADLEQQIDNGLQNIQ